MSKYIPVYEYAKKRGVTIQTVYRWIRERKLKDEDVKRETVTVERLKVKATANV